MEFFQAHFLFCIWLYGAMIACVISTLVYRDKFGIGDMLTCSIFWPISLLYYLQEITSRVKTRIF